MTWMPIAANWWRLDSLRDSQRHLPRKWSRRRSRSVRSERNSGIQADAALTPHLPIAADVRKVVMLEEQPDGRESFPLGR
jgi:hypothetical protein